MNTKNNSLGSFLFGRKWVDYYPKFATGGLKENKTEEIWEIIAQQIKRG